MAAWLIHPYFNIIIIMIIKIYLHHDFGNKNEFLQENTIEFKQW